MTHWNIPRMVRMALAPLLLASTTVMAVPLAFQPAHAAGYVLAQSPLERLQGTYAVDGRNPDGSRYRGEVSVSVSGQTAQFQWKIGNDSYRGKGTLKGNVLTVYWGQPDPVIYIVNDDGTLSGTWSNGRASEQLVPN